MSTPCHDPQFPFGERGEDHIHQWTPYIQADAWEICPLCRGVRPSVALRLTVNFGGPRFDDRPLHPEWHPSYREIL